MSTKRRDSVLRVLQAAYEKVCRERDWNFKRWQMVAGDHMRERARRQKLEHDLKLAAGDLPVPIPEPGTTEARLLAANALLKKRVAFLEDEQERWMRWSSTLVNEEPTRGPFEQRQYVGEALTNMDGWEQRFVKGGR